MMVNHSNPAHVTLITCRGKLNLGRLRPANISLKYCAVDQSVQKKWAVRRCDPPVFDSQDELMKSVDVLEAGLVRHGEDDEETVACPHVLLPHGAEFLLTGCVQHCRDGEPKVAWTI